VPCTLLACRLRLCSAVVVMGLPVVAPLCRAALHDGAPEPAAIRGRAVWAAAKRCAACGSSQMHRTTVILQWRAAPFAAGACRRARGAPHRRAPRRCGGYSCRSRAACRGAARAADVGRRRSHKRSRGAAGRRRRRGCLAEGRAMDEIALLCNRWAPSDLRGSIIVCVRFTRSSGRCSPLQQPMQ
jgi:hypothetical protein